MKKFALGLAVGATLIATGASAAEQRPTYLSFSAPAASAQNVTSAVATPSVSKRSQIAGAPVWLPILGLVAFVGVIAAVASGGNGSQS